MHEVIKGKVHRVYKPKDDNEFLEQVSFIIFVIGFNYNVVRNRWPDIKKAFKNFNVDKVMKADVDKIVTAEGMIKNKRKIKAIIENAKLCHDIQQQHGSLLTWISKLKKEHNKDPLLNPPLREEFEQFIGIGKTTSVWLDNIHNAKGRYLEWSE